MSTMVSLHDVMPYLYTGMATEDCADWKISGFPVGGIKFFMRSFGASSFRSMGEFAMFFDSSSDRKLIYPEYKSKRNNPGKLAVYAQAEVLMDLLMKVGIPCYKEDGFEADDLIYSASEQFRKVSPSVKIYTADADLSHNVCHNVSLVAVNSNINNITVNNFTGAILPGQEIMYNTISAWKVFCGDNSDTIPAFVSDSGMKGEELYHIYTNYLKEHLADHLHNAAIIRDEKVLRLVLSKLNLSDNDMKFLDRNIKLVYPKVSDKVFRSAGKDDLDKLELSRLFSMVGEYAPLRFFGGDKYALAPETAEAFKQKAHSLRSGEFAADRSLPFESKPITGMATVMREF